MDDLISRQAAIDEIKESFKCGDYLQATLRRLENLPSAEPNRWRTISKRPMDEEERKEWSDRLGYDIEYDDAFIYSNLPDDGEEVIICTHSGYVCTDMYYDDDGSYFDNHDLSDVMAWMPIDAPEPWKGDLK